MKNDLVVARFQVGKKKTKWPLDGLKTTWWPLGPRIWTLVPSLGGHQVLFFVCFFFFCHLGNKELNGHPSIMKRIKKKNQPFDFCLLEEGKTGWPHNSVY
jgi:hypothetical protein